MSSQRTQVQRNFLRLATRVGLAFIAGFWAFWLVASTPRPGIGTWGLAGVLVAVGVGLLFWARSTAADAKCPGCGLALRGVAAGKNEPFLCRSCVEFVEGDRGELWMVEPDRLADAPRFAAPCPTEAKWPAVCAVCGAPSTRTITASWERETDAPIGRDVATRVATLGTMRAVTRITYSVEVPHCERHSDGADLRASDANDEHDSKIVFRSHAYLRAFCAANKLTPIP